MRQLPISKKLIDLMGNQSLSSHERAWALLKCFRKECSPEQHPEAMRIIFESYGLAPRHDSAFECPEFNTHFVERVENNNQKKVQHAIEGWFEINRDQPIDRTLVEICMFLEQFSDERERAVILQMILASKHIPISPAYFSRHVDDKNDDLMLREYAVTFIKLRQTLNIKNIGPTSRGSLILDFLNELKDQPEAQSIVLGAFIEELLRRLKRQQNLPSESEPKTPNFGNATTFSLNPDLSPEQLRDMLNNFQTFLPPELLKQLRKLFGEDKDKGFD